MSAILVITTHGQIQVCSVGDLGHTTCKTEIPKGMDVVSLEVVPPGVVNFLPGENIPGNFGTIMKHSRGFNETTDKTDMIEFVKIIGEALMEIDDQPEFISGFVNRRDEDVTGDPEFMAYHYRPEFRYRVRMHDSGLIENKVFSRTEGDVTLKDGDWKLNLFIDGRYIPIDLMTEIHANPSKLRNVYERTEDNRINMEEILEYIKQKYYIVKLIIIDMSCCVFRDKKHNQLSKTGVRSLARSLERTNSFSFPIRPKKYSTRHNKKRKTRYRPKSDNPKTYEGEDMDEDEDEDEREEGEDGDGSTKKRKRGGKKTRKIRKMRKTRKMRKMRKMRKSCKHFKN